MVVSGFHDNHLFHLYLDLAASLWNFTGLCPLYIPICFLVDMQVASKKIIPSFVRMCLTGPIQTQSCHHCFYILIIIAVVHLTSSYRVYLWSWRICWRMRLTTLSRTRRAHSAATTHTTPAATPTRFGEREDNSAVAAEKRLMQLVLRNNLLFLLS